MFGSKYNFTSIGKSVYSFLFLFLLIGSASHLSAAVYTVTTTADNESNGCGSGQCTLREAIESANSSNGADTINFAPTVTGTITLTGGQLTITSDTTINGPGARVLSVSGNNASRVFLIATPLLGPDFTVTINSLTIRNGNATPLLIGSTLLGDGGGILNGALLGVVGGTSTLNLNDSAVTNNATTTLGGGIATRLNSVTTIRRSLINGNTCNPILIVADGTVGGAGIANTAFSTTNIFSSTITDNASLAASGGILNTAGTVNATNITVSNNSSVLAGGGIVSLLGTVPPILGVTSVRNSIVANNNNLLGTNIVGRDLIGALGSYNSRGNNLIGSNFGAEANFTASVFVGSLPQLNPQVDLVGGVDAGNQIINPVLGPLANNGGQVDTRAISTGSPAVNNGNNCVAANTCGDSGQSFPLMYDQRGVGFARQSGAAVDMGAYEMQLSPTAAEVSVTGKVSDSRGRGLARATVSFKDGTGAILTTTTNAFGNFRSDKILSGTTFIIEVSAKGYNFAPQVVNLKEDTSGLNFTGF